MAVDVIMPQMGESIFEGTITKWLKKPGDKIERDEPLFEISTDKVDAEIPSPAAGVLKEIKVKEGQTVPIQTVVASIDAAGAAAAASAPAPAKAETPKPAAGSRAQSRSAQAGAVPSPPPPAQAAPRGSSRAAALGWQWRQDSQLAAGPPNRPRTEYRSFAGCGHRRRRPHQQAGHSRGQRRRRARFRPVAAPVGSCRPADHASAIGRAQSNPAYRAKKCTSAITSCSPCPTCDRKSPSTW